MTNEMYELAKSLGIGTAGALAITIVVRVIVSWWRKQNSSDTNVTASQGLVSNLNAEADKWRVLYDKEAADSEQLRGINQHLKTFIALLKQAFKGKGGTDDEIREIEEQAK